MLVELSTCVVGLHDCQKWTRLLQITLPSSSSSTFYRHHKFQRNEFCRQGHQIGTEREKKMVKISSSLVLLSAASLLLLLVFSTLVSAKKSGDVTALQIGVKFKPESCEVQAHKGDRIKVHYRGKLTDGTVFDSSFERGEPIEFELGTGQVIKGWDQGILGMCIGEKRKLKIPSKLGYGDQGSPPKIPGGATLIFDTELVEVNGKGEKTDNSEL